MVKNRKRETLLEIIKKNIWGNSRVMSDCWKAYWVLAEEGYDHLMVNHSAQFADGEIHTNTIEGLWKHSKNELNRDGGTKDDQIQLSLDYFMFKKQYLKQPDQRFHILGRVLGMYWRSAVHEYPIN